MNKTNLTLWDSKLCQANELETPKEFYIMCWEVSNKSGGEVNFIF